MSQSNRFDYARIVGKKIDSIYNIENGGSIELLILNLGEEIFTIALTEDGLDFELEVYTIDEWIRHSDGEHIEQYYPYACFVGKVIQSFSLFDRELAKNVFQISFMQEGKKLSIAAENTERLELDLDIIRPGFTVDFGNKSIEEVDALLYDKQVEESNYATMTREVRAVYYYYSSVDNVFELAGYIYNIFKDKKNQRSIGRPQAYELATKLIY